MDNFYQKVVDSFIKNIGNDYHDNYDADRFGPELKKNEFFLKKKLKERLFKNCISVFELNYYLPKFFLEFDKHRTKLETLYNSLSDNESKELLIDLVCFRLLDNRKVKLKIKDFENDGTLEKIRETENSGDRINPNFLHFSLSKFDLNAFGKDIKMYFTAKGIVSDFFLEQYKYKNDAVDISAQKNDVVIDAGGCWGDTALYFAERVGENGRVYSFEFIPNNLAIFKKNCDLNPKLQDRIKVIDRPLSHISGTKVYYKDFGPGSRVQSENFEEAEGNAETESIDDFVSANNISKIDFIKMDIEGSELSALEGAKNVIRKYKPKLAIAIYHSWDDFLNIPKWILDLDLGYKIYLGHYTIHAEETVIFATT